MPRIFLDSTIQVRRLIYPPLVRHPIEHELQNHQVLTSTYVWMEVQRTVGQDMQYLINLLLTERPATVAQLMNHLGEGENLFSPRSLRRMLLIIAQLLDELGNTFEPLDAAYLLRRQKEWMIHRQFFDGIDQVIDGTACDLVQPTYKVASGGRISCRREMACCN
jgi:hypothetical protein